MTVTAASLAEGKQGTALCPKKKSCSSLYVEITLLLLEDNDDDDDGLMNRSGLYRFCHSKETVYRKGTGLIRMIKQHDE